MKTFITLFTMVIAAISIVCTAHFEGLYGMQHFYSFFAGLSSVAFMLLALVSLTTKEI